MIAPTTERDWPAVATYLPGGHRHGRRERIARMEYGPYAGRQRDTLLSEHRSDAQAAEWDNSWCFSACSAPLRLYV